MNWHWIRDINDINSSFFVKIYIFLQYYVASSLGAHGELMSHELDHDFFDITIYYSLYNYNHRTVLDN